MPENSRVSDAPSITSTANARDRQKSVVIFAALVAGFLMLYHAGGDFLPGNDARANIYLPHALLEHGTPTFTPDNYPHMFSWKLSEQGGGEPTLARVTSWSEAASDGILWAEHFAAGRLSLVGPKYYLAPTVDPERLGYANTFGIGAGAFAIPTVAIASLFMDDWTENEALLWFAGKFTASLCVALSVGVLFLAAIRLTSTSAATAIAIAYGAGTCVWSISSQSLWQSGPNVLMLSLAIYCLLRIREHSVWAAGCGAAVGLAVLCRPTSALVVIAIGGYLLAQAIWQQRDSAPQQTRAAALRSFLLFIAAGLPWAVLLGAYNWYYLGTPWNFGQLAGSELVAAAKNNSTQLWHANLIPSLYGILASPSRGLLVFSPILLFGFWGAVRAWRGQAFAALRPLTVAVVMMLFVQAAWFDWYGGWSFGYRALVDVCPLLAICAVAVIGEIAIRPSRLALCGVLLLFSIGVQSLGAFAYDVVGWNNRAAYLVEEVSGGEGSKLATKQKETAPATRRVVIDPFHAQQLAAGNVRVQKIGLDIDRPAFRHRLWSLSDSQIVYYATHFTESRRTRQQLVRRTVAP